MATATYAPNRMATSIIGGTAASQRPPSPRQLTMVVRCKPVADSFDGKATFIKSGAPDEAAEQRRKMNLLCRF